MASPHQSSLPPELWALIAVDHLAGHGPDVLALALASAAMAREILLPGTIAVLERKHGPGNALKQLAGLPGWKLRQGRPAVERMIERLYSDRTTGSARRPTLDAACEALVATCGHGLEPAAQVLLDQLFEELPQGLQTVLTRSVFAAAKGDHAGVLSLLLDYVEQPLNRMFDEMNLSPLHHVHSPECVRLLVDPDLGGMHPDVCERDKFDSDDSSSDDDVYYFYDYRFDNNRGTTPLVHAVETQGLPAKVAELLRSMRPVCVYLRVVREWDNPANPRVRVDAVAVDLVGRDPPRQLQEALWAAAAHRCPESGLAMAALLLDAGAEVDVRTLFFAVDQDNVPLVTRLLETHAHLVNATVLEAATGGVHERVIAFARSAAMARVLLAAGADPTALDSRHGRSALHAACIRRGGDACAELVDVLLAVCCESVVNTPDWRHHKTPLHYAVERRGGSAVVWLLLRAGARVDAACMALARESGTSEVSRMLHDFHARQAHRIDHE